MNDNVKSGFSSSAIVHVVVLTIAFIFATAAFSAMVPLAQRKHVDVTSVIVQMYSTLCALAVPLKDILYRALSDDVIADAVRLRRCDLNNRGVPLFQAIVSLEWQRLPHYVQHT
jgi:hypothetical protein